MGDFSNNLKKGDRVFDTGSKRVGEVSRDPKETGRITAVLFAGMERSRLLDVMQLRLMVNCQIEDVAPVDGEPPPLKEKPVSARANTSTPEDDVVETLKAKKSKCATQLLELERQHRTLRVTMEALDKAIAILAPPAPAIQVPRV